MKKKRIEIIASEESYRNLKTFEEISQLNNTVRTYKEKFKDKLSKTAIKVLDLIHRFSAKYTGVSFLYKNTIAESLKISRRTVIRICQLLESLGIIKQYEMKRKTDMRQTSNAIVIQPIKEEKNQNVTQDKPKMSHHKNNIFLKQNNNINHLNVKRRPYIKGVPKSLQHFQVIFGKHIKALYGRVWLAAKKLGVSVEQEIMQTIGFQAMDQLKAYVKNDKNLTKDDLCKVTYKIAYNQIKQRLDRNEIIDWNYEAKCFFEMKTKDIRIQKC